jgi:two-component system phosphate regulon sensor histidine kinase PhoR
LVVLVLSFAVLPGALLITMGILVLVFGHQPHDYLFGTLIVSLAATLIAGITATFLYVQRSTSLARLQTEFVQKVSHDLRTPLTSISMFAETLQEGRVTDPQKVAECLDLLRAETQRLTSMVERLLKWASMEAGRRIYTLRRVPVARIIDAALAATSAQVKLLELDGSVHIDCKLPPPTLEAEVDLDAMSEALANVLQNALHYTGSDKRIQLGCYAQGKEIVVTIADNGPGIAKHEQRRIFEKFYRAVDPAKPNVEGSGLGLAIVHNIVRAHAGRITVDSDLGRGTAFQIYLPVAGTQAEVH